MAIFCVSLGHTGEPTDTPAELVAALDLLPDHYRCHARLWLVKSAWTGDQLYTHLEPYLRPGDALLVFQLAGAGHFGTFPSPALDWLRRNQPTTSSPRPVSKSPPAV